uniref:Putative proteoglycan 4 n=1 Tax=Nyssomyia neivai TaxID=330878 RepID=A0A1L8E3N0_9DIPT
MKMTKSQQWKHIDWRDVASTLVFLGIITVILAEGTPAPDTASSPRYGPVQTLIENLQPPPLQIPGNFASNFPQRQEPSFFQKVASFFGFGTPRRPILQQPVQTQVPPNKYRNTERSSQVVSDASVHTAYPVVNSYTVPALSNAPQIVQQPVIQPQVLQHQVLQHQVIQPQVLQQQVQQVSDPAYFPCNKLPWVPMYNGAEIPVGRPEKYQEQQKAPYNYHPAPLQNAYLPAKQSAPNIWSQQVQVDPRYTPQPAVAGVTSPEYLPPVQLLPIQDTKQHHLVPIPVPNLSVTPIPPLYDYKPFGAIKVNSGSAPGGPAVAKITNIIVGTNVERPNNPGLPNRQYLPPAPISTGYNTGYNYPRPAVPFPTGSATNNVDPHSQVETFAPTALPAQKIIAKEAYNDVQTDFEIIKSIPLVQFTSSVHFPNLPNLQSTQFVQPAVLTTIPPEVVEISTPSIELIAPSNQKYISQPIIVEHEESTDSYTAASSHNITIQEELLENLENYLDTQDAVVVPPPKTFNFTEDDVRAVIQAASEHGKRIPGKKDRETPKNLLDSPIFHAIKGGNVPKPFTRDPGDLRVSQKPDHTPWLPTTTPWTTFSPYREPLRPTASSVEASGAKSGLEPPPAPFPLESINLYNTNTKRPKQIQIIIPYTSYNHPQPFKPADELREGEIQLPPLREFSKWSNAHNGQEYHIEEESQYITATQTPSTHKTTRFLNKIIRPTINIRELLRNEKDVSQISPLPFDIVTLQKNIDDWTEQEFASEPHKASTISLLAPAKKIPDEYLTTPSMDELYYQTTTMESTLDYDATSYELPQSDESSTDEFGRSATERIEDNEVQHGEDSPVKTEINPPLWGHLKVAISPLTHEKIYVVTPQPLVDDAKQDVGGFKSPRFTMGSRPTPGASSAGINSLQSKASPYVPELFGKLASSPFVSVSSEESDDVPSRKITIITPSPNRKRFTESDLERRSSR